MTPIRTAIMGVLVVMATALVPGVAQASTLPAAASAQPAAHAYSSGSVELCNNSACSKWTVEIVFAVTYNGSNVWVNGWPKCYQYGTQIAHCGYLNNGQPILDVYVDFGPGYSDTFDIKVGPSGQCAYFEDLGVIVKPHCP